MSFWLLTWLRTQIPGESSSSHTHRPTNKTGRQQVTCHVWRKWLDIRLAVYTSAWAAKKLRFPMLSTRWHCSHFWHQPVYIYSRRNLPESPRESGLVTRLDSTRDSRLGLFANSSGDYDVKQNIDLWTFEKYQDWPELLASHESSPKSQGLSLESSPRVPRCSNSSGDQRRTRSDSRVKSRVSEVESRVLKRLPNHFNLI